jgi:hypothetical protein
MSRASHFLDQFCQAGRPALSLRRCALFAGRYHVVAVWDDGVRLNVARFSDKASAVHWMELEGDEWVECFAREAFAARAPAALMPGLKRPLLRHSYCAGAG